MMGVVSIVKASALMLGVAALMTGTLPSGLSASSAAAKPDKNDRSRRVCREIVPSGSRLGARICRTQAEWDRDEAKAQDAVLRHQTNESTQYEPAARPQ
jgi:cytochrome c556